MRLLIRGGRPILTPEQFGATGVDAATDMAAFSALVKRSNELGGARILCQSGKTYFFDFWGGSAGIDISAPLDLNLRGATFKRPDAVLRSGSQRMMLLNLTTSEAMLALHGGVIDANFTKNPMPAGADDDAWQQSTSVFIRPMGTGVTVPEIHLYDLALRDRGNFDHLRIVPWNGARAALIRAHDIESQTDFPVDLRADLIWYGGCLDVQIDRLGVQRIETEFLGAVTESHVFAIRDSHTDQLDLGFSAGEAAKLVQGTLERVTCDQTWLTYFSLTDRNCVFGDVRDIRLATWRSTDSAFQVDDNGMRIAAAPHIATDIDWLLTRPTVRLLKGPQTLTKPAFRWPQFTTSFAHKCRIELIEPDLLDDFGVGANLTGTAIVREPKVRALGGQVWHVSGVANRQIDVTLIGGDYSELGPSTVPILINSWTQAHQHLTVGGNWHGDDSRITKSGKVDDSLITNARRVFRASPPATGIKGDELHLDGGGVKHNATTGPTTWIAGR